MTMVPFVYLNLFLFFLDVRRVKGAAISVYTPCLNKALGSYTLKCEENYTIYIRHHHVESVTSKMTSKCQGHNIGTCGMTLPLNGSIMDYQSPFAEAVNKCNNKTKCALQKTYFTNIEDKFTEPCKNANRPMKSHGIHYECISDSEVIHNCRGEDKVYEELYLRFDGKAGEMSCQIIGKITGVEILQTYLTGLTLSSNGFPLYEHHKKGLGVYGEVIPLLTNDLVIEVDDANLQSYVLLKVQIETFGSVFRVRNRRRIFINELAEDPNDFRTKPICCPENPTSSHVIWIFTVAIVVFVLVQVASIIYHRRALYSKATLILNDGADSPSFLTCRSQKQLGKNTKLALHRVVCMCDQAESTELSCNPDKDERIDDQDNCIYQNVTQSDQNPTTSQLPSITPEPKNEEIDIYVDMLPRA